VLPTQTPAMAYIPVMIPAAFFASPAFEFALTDFGRVVCRKTPGRIFDLDGFNIASHPRDNPYLPTALARWSS